MVRSLLSVALLVSFTTPTPAAQFADVVVSYDPGAGTEARLQNAAAALGSPDAITGEAGDFGNFPNVLSPFSPAFEGDELVQIGAGGHLTLRLSHYALTGAGPQIGVITNVGLIGSGSTGSPAAAFGIDDALVEVSADGDQWFSLGNVTFENPAIYYLNAGPFDSTPPASPQLADFGQPFTGSLSSFDNKPTYDDVVAVFAGSGGGTWLDASSTGLSQIGYVRFSLDPGASHTFELDAVALADAALGAPVPEPTALVLLAGGISGLLLHRRT